MKRRKGQVALYLLMVLVAIAVLAFVNVNVFLAVRSKNRLMNAVDAAALAAAKCQGRLLNELGDLNVRHLQALIFPDAEPWNGTSYMRERVMFGPLEALADAQRAAAEWGFSGEGETDAAESLSQHVDEIANEYCNNPDLYPEYRDGQWADYASRLANLVRGGLSVSPGYIESANAWSQEPLLSRAFYDAIAARAWCWFGFGSRRRYFDYDSSTMPRPEFQQPAVQENSEVYSLHVTFKSWQDSPWGGVFDADWTNFVCQVAGCTPRQLSKAPRVTDPGELWAFYDEYWCAWSPTFNPEELPLAGPVKSKYDVAGCTASCLIAGDIVRVTEEGEESRRMYVTAQAKPFGVVIGPSGGEEPVTAFRSFVAPSHPGERIFTEAQLVLMNAVPHAPGVSLEPEWYQHVREHLPHYFEDGPAGNGCSYCRQLQAWESPEFRATARNWLDQHHDSCRVHGPGDAKGGYDYAH